MLRRWWGQPFRQAEFSSASFCSGLHRHACGGFSSPYGDTAASSHLLLVPKAISHLLREPLILSQVATADPNEVAAARKGLPRAELRAEPYPVGMSSSGPLAPFGKGKSTNEG